MIKSTLYRAAELIARNLFSQNALVGSNRPPIETLEPRRYFVVLFVNGTPFNDTVVYDADANFIYASMNGVMIPQSTAVFDSVNIRTFDGDDHIIINNTGAGVVDIELGNGQDVVEITPNSSDLDNINAHVFIRSSTDGVDDSLLIDDHADSGNDSYLIRESLEPLTDPMHLIKGGVDKVRWAEANIGTSILLNEGDNTVTIDSTVRIEGTDEILTVGGLGPGFGGGNDTVNFNGGISADNTFQFNGGTGSDVFNVNGAVFAGGDARIFMDGGNDTGDTLNITDSANTQEYVFNSNGDLIDLFINDLQAGRYQYPRTELINIASTSATQGATYEVNGLGSSTDLSISAGEGNDQLIVGDNSIDSLDFGANVDITFDGDDGTDTVLIRDSSTTVARTHDWTGGGVYDHVNIGVLDLTSISTATLNCGSGVDSISSAAVPGPQTLIINGNGGGDSFDVFPSLITEYQLNGGSPTASPGDTLTVNPGTAIGGTLTPSGAGAGTIEFVQRDQIFFTGMENFPTPPVLSAPAAVDLSAGTDLGTSSTDNITNQTSLTFSGTGAAANSTVTIFRDGVARANTTATAGGAFTFSGVAFPTGDDTYVVTAAYTDAATGFLSPAGPALNVRVDTVAPATPGAPNLDAASDSGQSSTDNITNDTTPSFSGSVTANDLVRLLVGGVVNVSDTSTSGGSYAVTTATLAQGAQGMQLRFDDVAGNQSALSASLGVLVDTTAPAAPAAAPDLAAGSDSGTSNIDNLTNDNTPTLAVVGTELVRVLDGATIVADFAAPGNVVLSSLLDGVHGLTSRSVDVAGNQSAASTALNVTIDTVAPAAPAVAPDLVAGSDGGVSNTDNITNDASPSFGGSVTANDIVRLLLSGTVAGSDTSTPAGAYSITPALVSDNTYSVATRFEDLAGNQSGLSPTVSLTVDTVAPAAPTIAPDLAAASDSGLSSTDDITNDATPTMTGSRPVGTVARLVDAVGGASLGADTNLASAAYSITSSSLTDGKPSFATLFEDVAGNQSAQGPARQIVVDTVAPTTLNAAFDSLTSHKLQFRFSESVQQTLAVVDLTVQNLTTVTTVPNAVIGLAYVGATNTATYTFPGLPNELLADGSYQAALNSSGVIDVAGNNLTSASLNFFVLSGDATGDGVVDIADLGILATNWQQSPRNRSQGDFNNDGIVDIADLGILATNWQQSANAPAPVAGAATTRKISRTIELLEPDSTSGATIS